MRTMKFLMCVACLSSAAVITKTAMTQEQPVIRQEPTLSDPVDDPLDEPLSPATQSNENRAKFGVIPAEEQPLFFSDNPRDPLLDGNAEHSNRTRLEDGPKPSDDLQPANERLFFSDESIPRERLRSNPFMRQRHVTRTVIETVFEPIPQEELEASKKLQAAIQSLKTGKDEAARKAAADVIQQQLTTQFESDLKQREKELAEVEQRVKTLREQLDKRKAAQAEIINLRLQTLVNEANGLGFPGEDFRTDDLFLPLQQRSNPADRFESDSGANDPKLMQNDPSMFRTSPGRGGKK